MTEAVIDASALLTLLNSETGEDIVGAALPDSVISSVNYSEVIAKLIETGMSEETVHELVQPLGLEVVPFDEAQAFLAGSLRTVTRQAGLSFGDKACLSLGKILGVPVLTADRSWVQLRLGVRVSVIR